MKGKGRIQVCLRGKVWLQDCLIEQGRLQDYLIGKVGLQNFLRGKGAVIGLSEKEKGGYRIVWEEQGCPSGYRFA